MKRLGQRSSDRVKTTSNKFQGSKRTKVTMEKAVLLEDSKDLNSHVDEDSSKAQKKRLASTPICVLQTPADKRRRTSADKNFNSESKKGSKKLTMSTSTAKQKGKQVNELEKASVVEAAETKMLLQSGSKEGSEVIIPELKRLATTDGFWSSKPTSRSNSPVTLLDSPDGQLNPKSSKTSSLRGSRTSTPDISPSSSKTRLPLKALKKLSEAEELAKLNQLLELKRLKTTEGFWSPNTVQMGPRTMASRDGSPSSASSSLERKSKLIKPLQSSDNIKEVATSKESGVNSIKRLSRSKTTKTTKTSNRDVDNSIAQPQQIVSNSSSPVPESDSVKFSGDKRLVRPKKTLIVEDVEKPAKIKECTVAKPLSQSADPLSKIKRKAGRPKGSPNKKTLWLLANKKLGLVSNSQSGLASVTTKLKRGRPKVIRDDIIVPTGERRPVGRPRSVLGLQKQQTKLGKTLLQSKAMATLNRLRRKKSDRAVTGIIDDPNGNNSVTLTKSKAKKKSQLDTNSISKLKDSIIEGATETIGILTPAVKRKKKIQAPQMAISSTERASPIVFPSDRVLVAHTQAETCPQTNLLLDNNINDNNSPVAKMKRSKKPMLLQDKQVITGEGKANINTSLSIASKSLVSNIRITPELKRLNTTAGFWAPTPDFGSVINMPNIRRSLVRNKAASYFNRSPKKSLVVFSRLNKPESSLLQHRKKKLNSLKNNMLKVKHLSKAESVNPSVNGEPSKLNALLDCVAENLKGDPGNCFENETLQIGPETMVSVDSPMEETESVIRGDLQIEKHSTTVWTVTDKSLNEGEMEHSVTIGGHSSSLQVDNHMQDAPLAVNMVMETREAEVPQETGVTSSETAILLSSALHTSVPLTIEATSLHSELAVEVDNINSSQASIKDNIDQKASEEKDSTRISKVDRENIFELLSLKNCERKIVAKSETERDKLNHSEVKHELPLTTLDAKVDRNMEERKETECILTTVEKSGECSVAVIIDTDNCHQTGGAFQDTVGKSVPISIDDKTTQADGTVSDAASAQVLNEVGCDRSQTDVSLSEAVATNICSKLTHDTNCADYQNPPETGILTEDKMSLQISDNVKSTLPALEFNFNQATLMKKKRGRKKKLTLLTHQAKKAATTAHLLPGLKEYVTDSSSVDSQSETSLSSQSDHINVEGKPFSLLLGEKISPRVRRKRRNAWKKGVVKKIKHLARNIKKEADQMTQSKLAGLANSSQIISTDQLKTDDTLLLSDSLVTFKTSSSEKYKRMLRRLQTNANLASAVLNEETFSGRFLRHTQPKEGNYSEAKRETPNVKSMTTLHVDIPVEVKKRGPGRPRRLSCSFPKLTPPDMSGPLSVSFRHKSPPRLSPQVDPPLHGNSFFTFEDCKSHLEENVPVEGVDESDLHLYLSGASNEDLSPEKDVSISSVAAAALKQENSELLNLSLFASDKDVTSAFDVSQTRSLLTSPGLGKESIKKICHPKIKGRKGKPPGMPMTEEERRNKKNKADAKLLKNVNKALLSTPGTNEMNYNPLFKRPRTARKSCKTSTEVSPPSSTFSLRKKSTRSPLEMLEMKRRQEEAIYDLEEEKRLARRNLLREKRSARESCDMYFDVEIDPEEMEIKPCSVLLTDFVKKLQLDNLDSFSDNSLQEAEKRISLSPVKVSSQVETLDEESWCSNLENLDSDDEEWRVNETQDYRPYIPRLKLKRVNKKDRVRESGSKSPRSSTPKSEKEPIKIVIKAEPITDGAAGHKSVIDLSQIKCRGFVGSYVDFLKDCRDMKSRKVANTKRSYVSKALSTSAQPSTETPQKIKTSLCSRKASKNSESSGEVEEEDILIVDLDESLSASDERPGESPKGSKIHRTISNDEMGLMFASYHDSCEPSPVIIQPTVIGKEHQGDEEIEPCPLNSTEKGMDQTKQLSTSVVTAASTCEELTTDTSPDKDHCTPAETSMKDQPVEHVGKSPRSVPEVIKGLSPPVCSTNSWPDEWKLKVIPVMDKLPDAHYRCKRCDFNSSVRLNIESHIYSHIPGVQFRCAYCQSEFSSVVATVTHLKNVHSSQDPRLYISRHIEEKSFYEMEETVTPSSPVQPPKSQAANAGTDGMSQSPPLIISVFVSREIPSRGGRVSTPHRRFVCTHCGFSTNVKEDAEHHKNDLHPSENLFACLLCNENIVSSEAEMKQHSASVHPSHSRSYRKLPDFYDSEQLSGKGKSPNQEDREIIFEKISSIFQGDKSTQDSVSIDHRQKAKDYLYLQEEWKETTTVEADSTTAVEFMEDSMDVAAKEVSPDPCVDSLVCQEKDIPEQAQSPENVARESRELPEVAMVTPDAMPEGNISSSAVSSDQEMPSLVENSSDNLASIESNKATDETDYDTTAVDSAAVSDISTDESLGLKIVQVVSLSEPTQGLIQDPVAKEVLDALAEETTLQSKTLEHKSEDVETSVPEQNVPQDLSINKHTIVQVSPKQSRVEETPQSTAAGVSQSSTSVSGLPLSYKCNACKVHTPYLLMMVKHLKARHPNMRCFACPYCKAINSFISQKQLRHHVKAAHPEKMGRNEIALSEEAKKFVEAMVLPVSPECIKVGNRLVLEEDIHTCTYCQLKMTSLAQVYEHLNNKHSDLFEFVCPACQSFKSKSLQDIAIHCQQTHGTALDTDKVHVSVPKNLFHVLTCISKGGKYIQKNVAGGEDVACSKQTANAASTLTENAFSAALSAKHRPASMNEAAKVLSEPSKQLPAQLQSTPMVHQLAQHPVQPIVLAQTPLVAYIPGGIPGARPCIAFSSALFDTSSLTSTPHLISTVASNPQSVLQTMTVGASSLVAPGIQKSSRTDAPGKSPSPTVRHHKPKHLPVLNVPSIRPRVPQPATTPEVTPRTIMPQPAVPVKKVSPPSYEVDNLPDSEPEPDAFKIFNLQPSAPLASPSSSSKIKAPIVFPPVSSPVNTFIQGPLAGFPPNMIVPHNLVPFAYRHSHLMSRSPYIPHRPATMPSTESPRSTSTPVLYSKISGHGRESQHLEQLRQHMAPGQPSQAGYHHATVMSSSEQNRISGPSDNQQMSSLSSSSSVISSRPTKGIHKRSSVIYQCPYCSVPLKALEVASHIHQFHPGCQVTFKKITQ